MDPAGSTSSGPATKTESGPPVPTLDDLEALMPLSQFWTPDGYPIVDGKYLDLSTGELRTHRRGVDLVRAGPPTVSVYWQNQLATGRQDQFLVISGAAAKARDVTDYLARLGAFLAKGLCTVRSLNATRYDVYVVVSSELSQQAFRDALVEHGLL